VRIGGGGGHGGSIFYQHEQGYGNAGGNHRHGDLYAGWGAGSYSNCQVTKRRGHVPEPWVLPRRKAGALYSWRPEYSTFNVVPQTSYYVGLEFLPSKDIKSLTIRGNDFVDGFFTTNGLCYPMPDSDLKMSPMK
jgi:hypothetical protein